LALILLEPDMGTACMIFLVALTLLFDAGLSLKYIGGAVLAALPAIYLLIVRVPYRYERVMAFFSPGSDPQGRGFQLLQSLIAVGSGGLTGVGLMESKQKLFYLPEAHTDFLFAVLAEELGLAGVVVTLALFLALVWRSLYIARLAANVGLKFQAYLAAGFGVWLGVQAFINIGVNMGALPTKGLTLPLMSYGRSSLMVTLAWVGLLLRVYHEASAQARGSASARESLGRGEPRREPRRNSAVAADPA
jgi:cell division protein FtsW